MYPITILESVDYLLIGHLTVDLTPAGPRLGGTVVYSALMAKALGLRVGIVTSWGGELPLDDLQGIPVASFPTDQSTTFENIYTDSGRVQFIRAQAPLLDYYHIPEPWRSASIVHLGPVAQEVEPSLVRKFPSSLICLTPQGWMRTWDEFGLVQHSEWPEAAFVLQNAGAAVISTEDINYNEDRILEMAASSRILAVTEGEKGVCLYWNGDLRCFRPPDVTSVDPTGAGDIFAAAFFVRLYTTRDPWEAARFATQLASISVTRPGLAGIPTPEEIQACLVEIL
jgi:sugar/nucleoside kinase (ribokinase family)